LKMWNIKTKKW